MKHRASSLLQTSAILLCAACSVAAPEVSRAADSAINTPARINTDGWADSPFISRDGRYLYFMYTPYNFFPAFAGGMPEKRGPDRPGHVSATSGNPYDDSDIYISQRLADGRWSPPQNLGMNTTDAECCVMVIDGPPRKIYYQTSTAEGANDIAFRMQGADGRWGPPQFLTGINTPAGEENPHISPDENSLWFASDREGGFGERDLWFSARQNGQWTTPVNLGPAINTAENEDQIWVSPVGNEVFFNRGGLYRTSWTENGFTPPQQIDMGHPISAEASLTDDGKEMFFAVGDPESERILIMRSQRQADGSWSKGVPVD